MRRTTCFRLLALVLAVACTLTMVAALSYDMDGDGVINVWDIQQVPESDKAGALIAALGGANELTPNADGVYEIYSPLGLYNIAKLANKNATFKLMKDIDLSGMAWNPIVGFCGVLDGNGKTISNVTITTSVEGDTGFFAYLNRYEVDGVRVQAQVKNLNLENVTITAEATADAQYIGLLTGSNRGVITNCTTTGSVTDTRTEVPEAYKGKVYVGTITGRNNNDDNQAVPLVGTVIAGKTKLTATAGSSNSADKVTGLTSKMAMFFSNEDTITYQIGIAGYSKAAVSGTWQDTTGSVEYKSEAEQSRRQGAVDAMYQMGTVKWTTSEELTYTVVKNGEENETSTHSTIYIPGRTYTGIPYNGSGTSYAHFLNLMQTEKDAQGRYVTVTGLENGTNQKTGFAALMGNDCSSAVGWAWASVAPSNISQNGVRVNTTSYMVPNEYNTKNYGVLPAGGYQVLPSQETTGVDARDTRSIINLNGGATGMAEYYAKASRGDALLFVEYELKDGTWTKDGGHARMLGYDPVIIRKADGSIDLDKSYVITHEQGDGLYDNRNIFGNYEEYNGYNIKYTSWRTDYKYTLAVLLTEKGYNNATRPGCGYGYVPVTVKAFSTEGNLRAPYLDPGYTSADKYHPVILPNNGWYYSNYMVASVTMEITDSEGNQVYNKTEFMPCTSRSAIYQTVKLDEMFPDATDQLVEGQTYYETLTAKLGTGKTITELDKKAFTYPSTEILKS